MNLTFNFIAKAVGAGGLDRDFVITGFKIDSRSIQSGDLFIANLSMGHIASSSACWRLSGLDGLCFR